MVDCTYKVGMLGMSVGGDLGRGHKFFENFG